jgi:hypothetical protein
MLSQTSNFKMITVKLDEQNSSRRYPAIMAAVIQSVVGDQILNHVQNLPVEGEVLLFKDVHRWQKGDKVIVF